MSFMSPALAVGFFTISAIWEAWCCPRNNESKAQRPEELASKSCQGAPCCFPVLPPAWKWDGERRFYFYILWAMLLS